MKMLDMVRRMIVFSYYAIPFSDALRVRIRGVCRCGIRDSMKETLWCS